MSRTPSGPPGIEKTRQPGRIRAVVLAVLVHAAFFAIIVFGVTWQSAPTAPVQAELWDKLPPAKPAPKVEPPPEPPEPPKPEPPKPEPPKPEPPKPEPPKPEPPKPDPEIALKAEREKRERLEKARMEEKRKADEKKKADDKKLEEKRKREEQEAKKKEDERKRREEEAAKAAAESARAEAASARKKEIDRFIGAIRDKIRGKANVPDTVTGNPEVVVRIRVLPGGEVLDIAITKRSGNPAYDAAIERGIRSASPLPVPPADSELFPQFRELNLNFRHER